VNEWQKPVMLLMRLISQHMKLSGGCILDAGCGSGSALVAALKCGMNVLAYDNDSTQIAGASSR